MTMMAEQQRVIAEANWEEALRKEQYTLEQMTKCEEIRRHFKSVPGNKIHLKSAIENPDFPFLLKEKK